MPCSRKDLGRHEAEVMLWDAIRVRASGDDDKELAVMQPALDMGLPEADAAFARGMIAETTPDAVDQFKEAIEHDAFHHRATSALVGVLLSLGRLSEVRQYATLGHLLFPDDPNFPLMLGCAAALEGDWTTAKRAYRRRLQPARRTNADGDAGHRSVPVRHARLRPVGLGTHHLLQGLVRVLRRREFAQKRHSGLGAGDSSDSASAPPGAVFFMTARPVRQAYSLFPTAMKPFLNPFYGSDYSTAIDAAAKAARIQPEATFHFIHGSLLLIAQRNREAEEAFLAAAKAPTLFHNFHRRAYYVATAAVLNVYYEEGNKPEVWSGPWTTFESTWLRRIWPRRA